MTEVSRRTDTGASAGPGAMEYDEPEVVVPEHEEPDVEASPRARWFIKSPRTQIVLALAVYIVVWFSTVASTLVRHPNLASLAQRNMDPDLFVWVLGWWPHAITHGLNPLFSSLVSAPSGQPLGWVTTIPPLGILAAPLTLTAGPIVSFSLLTALGPPVAAWGAFVLCRRLTGKFWPALVGGAVFGFSAYETRASGVGQLDLSYSVLLPVLAYLMVVWWQHGLKSRTYVILAAAALALQFYLFTEIFADLTAILIVALLLGFALAGREHRPAVLRLGRLTAVGYVIALVLASPLIRSALSSKAPKPVPFTAMDLASFVLPRQYSVPSTTTAATTLVAHSASGAGYIGVPLLILAVLLAVTSWRNGLVRLLTCMLVLIIVASLGPEVYLRGRPEARLPWAALFDLPVVRNAWMSRLMIFAFLALAVATALWLSHPGPRSGWRQWLFPSLRWLLAALVVASVVIDVFPVTRHELPAAPAFITSGQYRYRISPHEIVVVVSDVPNAGLLWQAQSGYNIRLAGGFFNEGFGSTYTDEPLAVAGLERRNPALVAAFVTYIKRDKIGAILVDAAHEPRWARLIRRVGLVGHLIGGVIVFPTDGCRACTVPTKHL